MSVEEIYAPRIRMEEEETLDRPRISHVLLPPNMESEGEGEGDEPWRVAPPSELGRLLEERQQILRDDRLKVKEKLRLLESNRLALLLAHGGTVRKTENVVYGILGFGAVVLIILALLTTFAHLPAEVTLSFVGTVLGGTIATIAQKLGKI